MSDTSNLHTVNIVVKGGQGVGKTQLINRLVNDEYNRYSQATIGCRIDHLEVSYQGKDMTLKFWDTPGSLRFSQYGTGYLFHADMVFLCYAIDGKSSYQRLSDMIDETNRSNMSAHIVLVGLRCDQVAQRQVSKEAVEQLAAQHQCQTVELSSQNRQNVESFNANLYRHCLQEVINPKVRQQRQEDIEALRLRYTWIQNVGLCLFGAGASLGLFLGCCFPPTIFTTVAFFLFGLTWGQVVGGSMVTGAAMTIYGFFQRKTLDEVVVPAGQLTAEPAI